MSSKRKAASGSAAFVADNGDAHTAKRRKLPVSIVIVDFVSFPFADVGGMVMWGEESTSSSGGI